MNKQKDLVVVSAFQLWICSLAFLSCIIAINTNQLLINYFITYMLSLLSIIGIISGFTTLYRYSNY